MGRAKNEPRAKRSKVRGRGDLEMRSVANWPPCAPTRQTCKSVFLNVNLVTDVFTVFKLSVHK